MAWIESLRRWPTVWLCLLPAAAMFVTLFLAALIEWTLGIYTPRQPQPIAWTKGLMDTLLAPIVEGILMLWLMRVGRVIWRPGWPEVWASAFPIAAVHWNEMSFHMISFLVFFAGLALLAQELYRRGYTFWGVLGWTSVPHALWNGVGFLLSLVMGADAPPSVSPSP